MLARCKSCDSVVDIGLEAFAAAHLQAEQQVEYLVEVDIEERADRFVLIADLPGVKEDDIDVEIRDGMLSISGARQRPETYGALYRQERRQGTFSRKFHLGALIDVERIDAQLDSGVLTVELPKAAPARSRTAT